MIRKLANTTAIGVGSAALVMVGIATPAASASGLNPFRYFGSRWQPVSSALADALAEGGSRGATTRNWERCAVRRDRHIVVCPDGHVERW